MLDEGFSWTIEHRRLPCLTRVPSDMGLHIYPYHVETCGQRYISFFLLGQSWHIENS